MRISMWCRCRRRSWGLELMSGLWGRVRPWRVYMAECSARNASRAGCRAEFSRGAGGLRGVSAAILGSRQARTGLAANVRVARLDLSGRVPGASDARAAGCGLAAAARGGAAGHDIGDASDPLKSVDSCPRPPRRCPTSAAGPPAGVARIPTIPAGRRPGAVGGLPSGSGGGRKDPLPVPMRAGLSAQWGRVTASRGRPAGGPR